MSDGEYDVSDLGDPSLDVFVRRVRLDISYDGTAFSGWAIQPGQRTVQGVLEQALATILRTPIALTVAGRTDAGVHAHAQVAHADLASKADPAQLLRRLARLLPPDVRVRHITPVSADFDARFAALWRRYEYRVCDSEIGPDPLRRFDVAAVPPHLDVPAMQDAASGLLGEHDFAAFCRAREGATSIRNLQQLKVERNDDLVVFTVQADAFCHSMVRSLVGALLAVGHGRRERGWPASLLERDRRADEVVVAPAHGLTLTAVGYPPDDQLSSRVVQTRRVRVRMQP